MYCIRRAFLRLTKSCLKLYFCFLPLAALYEYKSYNYRRDRSKAHGDSDTVEAEITLKEENYAVVGKNGPDEAMLKRIMAKTGADMALMMSLDELSLDQLGIDD